MKNLKIYYISESQINYLRQFDKNGKKNYIGGATFIEIYEAFMKNKKIFLYNDVPEGMLYDEISGFSPIVINGDLNLVKQEQL